MKLLKKVKKKENLVLLSILIVAAILRFYRLSDESFWMDELWTMNIADPGIPLHQLFNYLGTIDTHPPAFFLLERLFFMVFGRSEWLGRFIPAAAGVASVWAMYRLGKEVSGKRLGLTAAIITCVNYFDVYFSREARMYSLVLLTSALSFLFLVRLFKQLRAQDMWLYTLFAMLTMYIHYYGIFLVASQFCVALYLLYFEEDKKLFIRRFFVSGLILALVYLPWLPYLGRAGGIRSFWISQPPQDFMVTYFWSFFGNSEFLKPILILLLVFYAVKVFGQQDQNLLDAKHHPLTLSFVIFAISIVITYTVPYMRSLLVVPMLHERYAIVLVPVFLLIIAFAIDLIPQKLVRGVVLGTFTLWSLIFLIWTNHTYTYLRKTSFREATAYMAADARERQDPVLNDVVAWGEGYYLGQFHYKGPLFSSPRKGVIDSITHRRSPKYDVDAFWIMAAHGAGDPATFLDSGSKASLDSFFVLRDERRWSDAWVQLYVSRSGRRGEKLLTPDAFPGTSIIADGYGKQVAIWGGAITSSPVAIPAGNYAVRLETRGTPAKDSFPHLVVYINDKRIGDFYTARDLQRNDLNFKVTKVSDSVRVRIDLINDCSNPAHGEDRNAFVREVTFFRQ